MGPATARATSDQRPRESFTLEEIGDRDGWVCGICLDPIDQQFAAPDARSPSIDHVKAIFAGGTHTRDNVRITHLYCNMDRSYIDRPRRLIVRNGDGQIILEREVNQRTPASPGSSCSPGRPVCDGGRLSQHSVSAEAIRLRERGA
jgi:hypothetical protein